MEATLTEGVVYTETVVYAGPERFAAEAPYQIAIVELPALKRVTARIVGTARVEIGDPVVFEGYRDGVPCFRGR